MDLSSSVLIKDNHLAAVDGQVEIAIRRARELAPQGARIEIECITVDQVAAAATAGANIILLDNMPLEMMRECVKVTATRAELEASGGVTLENVRAIAETGVDMISVGALTHSAAALNLALDFE
jgi:nicotinate-nucleotide pyrophosphorylase (carboxylating)